MVYIFLAEGFEEIEAIAPIDMLRRGKVEVVTVGVGQQTVAGAHGISVVCDALDRDIFVDAKTEMLILPGGGLGVDNIKKSRCVEQAMRSAVESGIYIGAICAAPSALGEWGLLRGKSYTCYPGCQSESFGGEYTGAPVAMDGRLITAIGPGASLGFGCVLLSALCGEEAAQAVTDKMIIL